MKTKEKIRNVPSIENLRECGYLVRVYHGRRFVVEFCSLDSNGWNVIVMSKKEMKNNCNYEHSYILCHGGYTRLDVRTPDGKEYTAKFNFAPTKNFNRKIGIRACLGRIVAQGAELYGSRSWSRSGK